MLGVRLEVTQEIKILNIPALENLKETINSVNDSAVWCRNNYTAIIDFLIKEIKDNDQDEIHDEDVLEYCNNIFTFFSNKAYLDDPATTSFAKKVA